MLDYKLFDLFPESMEQMALRYKEKKGSTVK